MVGVEKQELGLLFDGPNFKVVKKGGQAGEKVENHNHPEAHVVFTVVKGKVDVQLNQEEQHILEPGTVLQFDGNNYIQATLVEDSEFIVTLVTKPGL
ncbi:cupin domain-containing protein [uncultured Veillonella sp.]|uniref:cupin domain-containing protein n=1 Tax=uncultured Veillonella sp. TaxID=159268 RepID=UPI0025F24A1D|nr:cupin domain-containing protein [uncultured Veillonella sp.]MDY3974505.1 cupin domain-containing protein [Veillonella caviae]